MKSTTTGCTASSPGGRRKNDTWMRQALTGMSSPAMRATRAPHGPAQLATTGACSRRVAVPSVIVTPVTRPPVWLMPVTAVWVSTVAPALRAAAA